jgi:hypothetical protein
MKVIADGERVNETFGRFVADSETVPLKADTVTALRTPENPG